MHLHAQTRRRLVASTHSRAQWFLLNFLLFFKALHGVNPMPLLPSFFPLCLCASALGVAVSTTRGGGLRFGARTLRRIVCAPCESASVSFWEAFAADGLTSLVGPISDLVYAGCYFGSGEWLLPLSAQGVCEGSVIVNTVARPLVVALPLVWRLCQNLRQVRVRLGPAAPSQQTTLHPLPARLPC